MVGSTAHRAFLSAKPATRLQWRLAIAFLAVSLAGFVVAVPFVRTPLTPVPSFIPSYESALFFNDLITAVLLFGHFMQSRSQAILALGAGYLFDALMIVPHALTFPGAFTATGLLGAGPQTTAWLYVFWHGGFPPFVIAYALLRRREPGGADEARSGWIIAATLAGVVAVVTALTLLATVGGHLLPQIMQGSDYSWLVTKGISPAIWALAAVALVALWRADATVLDLYLMVVMGAWLMDIALSAVIGSARYDLGFYAGRIYGLIAASVVLIALLMEFARERRMVALQLIQTQKMEAVGQLTGGIAHDFNNLLAGVIGNLELAIEQVQDGSELKSTLDEALASALRGADLVKRLLAFSRVQPLRLRSLDLMDAIRKMAPLLASSLGEQVSVDVVPAEGLWPVRIDQAEFENALLNICINARDAMSGGGRITIETTNFVLERWFAKVYPDLKLGAYVVLSIHDTGTGMPSEVIARAFDPFYTTKETGKGTGLGLSMVHGYMKQSGGAVKIYSELGVGTTVSLYFPRGTDDGDAAARTSEPIEAPRGSERILVVEDNPAVRKVAVNILSSLGYRVEAADGARPALTLLRQGRFDAVFSDVVMPEMNGIALAGAVRRLYPGVAVLLTSGFSSKLSSTADLQALDIDFVAKPYRKADLAVALRGGLDRQAARRN